MGFERIVTISTSRDHQPQNQNTILAEVVVLDKTRHDLTFPILFQVKGVNLTMDRMSDFFGRLTGDVFVMIGEVVSIDKRERKIQLANGDTVMYRHMVTVENAHQTDQEVSADEFAAGVQALIEALKLRNKVPTQSTATQPVLPPHPGMSFVAPAPRKPKFTAESSTASIPSQSVAEMAEKFSFCPIADSHGASSARLVFEVQV